MRISARRARQTGMRLALLAGLAGCGPAGTGGQGTETQVAEGGSPNDPGGSGSTLPDAPPPPDATPPDATPPPDATGEPDPGGQPAQPPPLGKVVWDDFDYASWKDPAAGDFGWRFRTGTGWPGQHGVWSADQIVFLPDPDDASNRIMRLQSYTDGVDGPSTVQTQASRQPPSGLHGTFAARTRFRPLASAGPDNPGDQLVQTFYMIVGIEGGYADPGYPLRSYEPYDRDPYSEMDFEFLPHGGWGWPASSMTVTTWAPGLSSHGATGAQYPGWHVWSITFDGSRVVYACDGVVFHEETGAVPRTVMSMNFNQWFINLGSAGSRREYWEDVDWVLYADQEYLTNSQILERVAALRSAGLQRADTTK